MNSERLKELAKKRGLDVAEHSVQELMEFSMDLIGEVVKSTKNPFDDMIWGAIELKTREILTELIDKIDGEKG